MCGRTIRIAASPTIRPGPTVVGEDLPALAKEPNVTSSDAINVAHPPPVGGVRIGLNGGEGGLCDAWRGCRDGDGAGTSGLHDGDDTPHPCSPRVAVKATGVARVAIADGRQPAGACEGEGDVEGGLWHRHPLGVHNRDRHLCRNAQQPVAAAAAAAEEAIGGGRGSALKRVRRQPGGAARAAG